MARAAAGDLEPNGTINFSSTPLNVIKAVRGSRRLYTSYGSTELIRHRIEGGDGGGQERARPDDEGGQAALRLQGEPRRGQARRRGGVDPLGRGRDQAPQHERHPPAEARASRRPAQGALLRPRRAG